MLFEEAHSDVRWRLDALLDLGQFRDARIVTVLLRTVASRGEPTTVRQAALKHLRSGALTQPQRGHAARVLVDIVAERTHADLALTVQASDVLGDFTDIGGVVHALGNCVMDTTCHFDVRYAAFTALERTGPKPQTITIFTGLRSDETLGRSAQAILTRWHVDE